MNEENVMRRPNSGGKAWVWIVIIALLIILGALGWYFFLRKSVESGKCATSKNCESGLICAAGVCSSGKVGSTCSAKADCKTGYCVNQKCTEGKAGGVCVASKDCSSGLFCPKSLCAALPDYSKYFSKVVISKIKPGSGPGPNNPITVTSTFTTADAIEMDFYGVKSTTVGEYYYEIVNLTSGEVVRSSKNEEQLTFNGQDRGNGTALDNVAPGEYDLNIYFKGELVYSTQISVTK